MESSLQKLANQDKRLRERGQEMKMILYWAKKKKDREKDISHSVSNLICNFVCMAKNCNTTAHTTIVCI